MTPELKEKLAGRRVVASVSGGKDSAAMSLWLTEQEIEHDRVFMDTGWEHPATYEYLRGELTRVLGPITEIRGSLTLPELVKKKAMFPRSETRFCTQELKVFPMQRHLAALMDSGVDVVNAVGIRRAESRARSAALEWEWSDDWDCEIWRPIVDWFEENVIDIHRRHGLRPNPLYLNGARRVGCWPCVFCSKEDIANVARLDPGRIDAIRDLEADVQTAARERYAAKGETFESLGYEPPTFFKMREAGETNGRPKPIDYVVTWARTSHGGRQLKLLETAPDAGCMRWGLCDTGTGDKE